jgi:hypothetical protein
LARSPRILGLSHKLNFHTDGVVQPYKENTLGLRQHAPDQHRLGHPLAALYK